MRSLAIDSSLEGIAGPPLAMLTVPNTDSSPLDLGPTEARTLYAVGSTTELSYYTEVASIRSITSEGSQLIRSCYVGSGGLQLRGQVIGGNPILQDIEVGWPWNTPMAGCGWWDGSRFGSQGYRSTPTVSSPSAGGSMRAAPCLRLAPISVAKGTTPIAALTYRGVHDLATRTRILNWLMQRYGSL